MGKKKKKKKTRSATDPLLLLVRAEESLVIVDTHMRSSLIFFSPSKNLSGERRLLLARCLRVSLEALALTSSIVTESTSSALSVCLGSTSNNVHLVRGRGDDRRREGLLDRKRRVVGCDRVNGTSLVKSTTKGEHDTITNGDIVEVNERSASSNGFDLAHGVVGEDDVDGRRAKGPAGQ